MQKRILFLGGAASHIPPIKYAKEQGHYVIISDNLPIIMITDAEGYAF